jgi:transketolase C-terminal domain/subunit
MSMPCDCYLHKNQVCDVCQEPLREKRTFEEVCAENSRLRSALEGIELAADIACKMQYGGAHSPIEELALIRRMAKKALNASEGTDNEQNKKGQ